MHVMIIAPEDLPIPPSRGGSVQIYLMQLYEALSKRKDLQVTLVSPGATNTHPTGAPISQHVTIHGSKHRYWGKVEHFITSLKPDVIQIDNRPAKALKLMKVHPEARFVLNLHSLTFLGPRHISQKQAAQILSSAHGIVCNSHDLANVLRRRYHMLKTWRYHVIYPGVQQTSAFVDGKRSTTGPLRLLFVGRVIKQKGVHIAIDMIKELRREFEVQLTVVGGTHPWEKRYREQLQTSAKGMNVKFTGFVQPNKLKDLYQSHDILICPSQQHEAFGLVNIEAMTHGLPIVASHIGGIPEAVGKDGGILIRSYRDAHQFANAVRKLRKPRAYRRYSKSAYRRAQKFTWSSAAREFSQLYRDIT